MKSWRLWAGFFLIYLLGFFLGAVASTLNEEDKDCASEVSVYNKALELCVDDLITCDEQLKGSI